MDISQISMVADSTCENISFQGTRRKLVDDFETPLKEKKQKTDGAATGKDHMKVYLRVRPFTEEEEETNQNQGCMELEDKNTLIARAPEGSNTYKNSQHGCGKQTHKFTFSKIFNSSTTQKMFFDETILSTVKDFIDGQNCLVFTYGVTNSGKTYTIQGHPKDGGILPRALDVLFNSIEGQQWESMSLKPNMFCDVVMLSQAQQDSEQKVKQRVLALAMDEESDVTVSSMVGDSDSSRLTTGSRMSQDSLNIDSGNVSEAPESSDKSAIDQLFKEAEERVREDAAVNVTSQGQIRFSVWVTFIEIYNEYIYDLLEPLPKKKNARRPVMTLREDKHGVPYVKGVKEIYVTSADEAYKILMIGKQNLQFACTKLNHNSSRSHCIFTIKVIRVVDKENPSVARVSMLSFCDLAGAERYSKTQSTGDRVKEAGNINTSLLSLGRCIKILRHNQTNREHQQLVPFRDSKLTRLFQSFFCGKGKASMIVNVNQCSSSFDETLHALKYSAIARQVVVVQDAPKAPADPPERRVRSQRYVSLALAQAANADPRQPRPTIGFATPGTLARYLQEEEDDEAPTPKAQLSGEEASSQESMLQDIIEVLREELLKEKNEKEMLEWNIRNEVCQEMQQQLVLIEKEHEEQMRHMKDRLEDRADSKVNILLQSMKKRKRQDVEDDEDVDETELLKVANEEKEFKIERLNSRIKELEEQVEKLRKNSNNQTAVENVTPPKQTDQMAVIEQLQERLSDAKAQIDSKDSEISELEVMLTEAGDVFSQKKVEMDNLQQQLDDYQQKFKEQEKHLSEVNRLLEEASTAKAEAIEQLNKKVASLNAQLEAANNKDCPSCQEQIIRLGDVISKLADTEAEVDKINGDFVSLQKELSQKNEDVKKLEGQVKKKDQDLKNLRENLKEDKQTDSQVTKLLSQVESLEDELKSKTNEAREVELKLTTASESKVHMENKLAKLQEVVDEHQNALRDHENFVAELNKQIKDASAHIEQVTGDRNSLRRNIAECEGKCKTLEEELFQVQEKLASLEEENTKLCEDIENKERRLQEDGRKSLQMENKVVALEQSLQQANGVLRETALEAAQYKEKLSELEEVRKSLEEKCSESKQHVVDLQTQLEDYVLKVNEQVEELGVLADKMAQEEKKSKGLQEKLTHTEKKIVDREGEFINLRNKVEDLETRLNAERKQQKSANNELDDLLQSKAVLIEELNTSVTTITNKLNVKEKQVEEHAEQMKELQVKLEHTSDELKSFKSQLKERKSSDNQVSSQMKDLQNLIKQSEEKIKKLQHELSSAKDRESTSHKIIDDMKNKMSGLELSLEMAQEDAKEIINIKVELEKSNKESEKKQNAIEKLNGDLAKAKASVKEKEKEEANEQQNSEEVVERLEKKIRQLEGEVSEAQYSAQMNSRMLRREKTQVEKRLKDSEEELEKARGHVLKVQGQLASDKLSRQSESEDEGKDNVKQELVEYKKKAACLEDVVKDLEDCLKSAKSSQQSALDTAKEYKKKCRAIEDDLVMKEDRLQVLESEMKVKAEKEELLKEKEREIESLNEQICDLEHSCKEYRVGMETMESRLSYVGELEEKNESILSELDHYEEKVSSVRQQLEEAQSRIKIMEEEVDKSKDQTTDNLSLRNDLENLRVEHDSKVEALREKLSEKETLLKNACSNQEKAELENKDLKEEINNITYHKEAKIAELEELSKAKRQAEEEMEKNVARSKLIEEAATKGSSEIEKLANDLNKVKDELKEKEVELEKSRDELKEDQRRLKNSEEMIKEKESELEKSQEKLVETEKQLEECEAKVTKIEKELEKSEKKFEETKKDQEELRKQREELENREASLKQQLKEKDEELLSLKRDVKRLNRQVDMLTSDKEEANVANKALLLEVEVKDKKIESLEQDIKKSTENLSVIEDLEKANKREKLLRTELSEASARQEEQNANFNQLEDKLRLVQESSERHEVESKQAKNTVTELQHQLAQKTSLEARIQELEKSVEKKDNKIKARNERVIELEDMISQYEVAVKDAQANEGLVESMKKGLEDQDATLELQEKVMEERAKELAKIKQEYSELLILYNSTKAESEGQSGSVAELTSQLRKLRETCTKAQLNQAQAEEDANSLKATLNHNNKDRSQMRRDLEETNRELREMEKMQSESRKEVDALKTRLAEMKDGRKRSPEPGQTAIKEEEKLTLLKTKFIALESDNKRLEEELDQLKKFAVTAEQEKLAELAKWREDRDRLVSQLEVVLKQKDSQIAEMKKASASTSKTDHELQNRIDKLEEELLDKDATIAELSKHLDDNRPPRSARTRRTIQKTAAEEEGTVTVLRKEMEDVRRRFEADRQEHSKEFTRVVRAKDAIINDLRETNFLLQARLPGGSQAPAVTQALKAEAASPSADTEEESGPSEVRGVKAPPRRSTRKGRTKKRKSSVLQEGAHTPSASTSRRKHSRKQSAQMQVSMDENLLEEETDNATNDKSMVTSTPAKRTVLTDLNTPSELLTTFISPATSSVKKAPQSERSKRRVRLRTTMAEPFAESPPQDQVQTPVKDESHEIVTRQLRTRRKCTKI